MSIYELTKLRPLLQLRPGDDEGRVERVDHVRELLRDNFRADRVGLVSHPYDEDFIALLSWAKLG